MNWNDYFISMAKVVASKSSDPSSKVGCIAVGPDNEIRSTGYNGFPRGVSYSEDRLERSLKYKFIEHAERNCIYNAARIGVSLKGCKLYVTTFMLPCTECTKAIIQSGIVEVITEFIETPERWKDDFEISKIMLNESGVKVIHYV